MEYIFDLTEKDYLNFNMFTATNYVFYQKQKRYFCLIFTILPSVVYFSMKFFEGRNFPGPDVVFVFLVSIVPLTVLIVRARPCSRKRTNKPPAMRVVEIALALCEKPPNLI